jgi:hypothetical protein
LSDIDVYLRFRFDIFFHIVIENTISFNLIMSQNHALYSYIRRAAKRLVDDNKSYLSWPHKTDLIIIIICLCLRSQYWVFRTISYLISLLLLTYVTLKQFLSTIFRWFNDDVDWLIYADVRY